MGVGMMRLWIRSVAALALLVLVPGCYGVRIRVEVPDNARLKTINTPRGLYADDLDRPGLLAAADRSLDYFKRAKKSARFDLGRDTFTAEQIAASVDAFTRIIEETPADRVGRRISRECRAYTPMRTPRFTAYYEPVLTASKQKTERFRYPVYQKPDEVTLVRLADFFPDDTRHLHGAVDSGRLLPFLTREQIDGNGRLHGRGLELAWVDDPVALFFLHIQGSGRLRMDGDGDVLRVNYAASNGLPYTSIGRYMLDNGILTSGSSGAIRSYLSGNPNARNDIMFRNQRYIFFRKVELAADEGPIGSLGVPLVAGRSIATDARYIPPGSVLYIRSKRPVTDEQGKLTGWENFSRFAFSHDSGAAIKGPARADIYWGDGEEAGAEAGYMSQGGKMVVLMCGVRPSRGGPRGTRTQAGKAFTRVAWADVVESRGATAGAGM
jgi:membrane-bound lytic murein transglycosylase A